ncbi:hypothetical protein [Chelativorans sp. Marseille-P2723]|uniref:hypothetical protein n=1 Tax=Chelativorans sp. Marseille-P2723 TaxID=2709133 RepID=UPI00157017F1|nr:hypothetical protein [Chelativorans sp. Marseille-P2723]
MDAAIEREFIAGFARAGLKLPKERYELMVQAYAGYRELAALLHEDETPLTAEPAGLEIPAVPENRK